MVDSGINPYHEAFRSHEFDNGTVARMIGVPVTEVNLSQTGSFGDRIEADQGMWSSLKPGQLYHFAGTRVVAISMLNTTKGSFILDDSSSHGTATAGVVAKIAQSSLIVAIQGSGGLCTTSCLIDPSLPNGVAWAAHQPWIDVISISFGNPGNPPDDPSLHPEMQTYLDGTRLAASEGKLVVAAAGNDPSPTMQSYTCGPPWIICIGGFEPSTNGTSADSSHGVDFISNVTAFAPTATSTENYTWRSGTSFSTPTAAGAFAEGLAQLREAGFCRALSPDCAHQMREAANASAIRFGPTDFNPTGEPEESPVLGKVFVVTVPIVGGAAQQGWGVVGPAFVPAFVKAVEGRVQPAQDSTSSYQAQYQSIRESNWK